MSQSRCERQCVHISRYDCHKVVSQDASSWKVIARYGRELRVSYFCLKTKIGRLSRIDEHDDHAPPIDEAEDRFHNDPNLMQRRNSRSLPTSPLHSPKAMRKFQPQPNPYFTITGSDAPPPKQSWFLTSLFGARRELTTSTMSVSSQIDEADEAIEPQQQQQPTTTPASNVNGTELRASPKRDKPTEVKPQPTLLREMNFWAPTSY